MKRYQLAVHARIYFSYASVLPRGVTWAGITRQILPNILITYQDFGMTSEIEAVRAHLV